MMVGSGRAVKVLVFDCDGVMFDTEKANRMYYNRILEQFGKSPLTQEQFEYVHMSTVKQALHFCFRAETTWTRFSISPGP